MTTSQCNIGELSKTEDGVVTLTVTCADEDITKFHMIEAVKAIDSIAETPSPLIVDASQSHSVSFDALIEMAKATNVVAVAIYAPSEPSKNAARFIEQFQYMIGKAPYPFKIFSDLADAKEWLKTLV